MAKFIELTRMDNNEKFLVNTATIRSIIPFHTQRRDWTQSQFLEDCEMKGGRPMTPKMVDVEGAEIWYNGSQNVLVCNDYEEVRQSLEEEFHG